MAGKLSLFNAAKTLPPLQQGAFDNLCGLYSAINAIRLSLWVNKRISLHRPQRLFHWGIDQIEKEWGTSVTLHEGMDIAQWTWLTDRIIRKAYKITGSRLQRVAIKFGRKQPDLDQIFLAISECAENREPVLIHISGAIEHYTILTGVSDLKIWLYDSHGRMWIRKDSCALECGRRRYAFQYDALHKIVMR